MLKQNQSITSLLAVSGRIAGGLTVDADTLAGAFLSLIPQMMGTLRRHIRATGGREFRVGHFRMMLAIYMRKEISISQTARCMGLTLPTASKMADDLERRKLIRRQADKKDRRLALLSLTAPGSEVLQKMMLCAQKHLAEIFGSLTPMERAFLLCAAQTLRPLFDPPAILDASASPPIPVRRN